MTNWMRKVVIKYGQPSPPGYAYGPRNPWTLTSEAANDLRVTFRFTRTNQSHADSGVLAIHNLPKEFADAIHSGFRDANLDRASILDDSTYNISEGTRNKTISARYRNDVEGRNKALQALAEANRIWIWAGYRDDLKLIFQGDITDLVMKTLDSEVDSITAISVGDSILTSVYGYLNNKPFGKNSYLKDTLVAVVSAFGSKISTQGLSFLNTNFPDVVALEFKDGYMVQGGIERNLDNLVAAYGVQWFFRNGEIYFMKRGDVFEDFALRLDEGRNMLRPIGNVNGEDIQFRMLMDGDMVPGRAFRIFNKDGKPTSQHGYRADTVEYQGDTHSTPWYTTVVASRIDELQVTLQTSGAMSRNDAFDAGAFREVQ